MTLAEVFALLAFIVSLLVLLVQVVHVTFDIAWRISHDNGNNDKKKCPPTVSKRWRSFFLTICR